MVDTPTSHLRADISVTRSPYGWMLRQYYEYFYNNITRQFWRILETPSIEHEMNGCVVVVTGASSGLGLETAKQLLIRATPRLLVVTALEERDLNSMNEELCAIVERKGSDLRTKICPYILHLHNFESVQEFAQQVQNLTTDLDVLLLNAGVVTSGWNITKDDLEKTVQINYVSNVMLTLLLLPLIKRTSLNRLLSIHVPRITFVASDGHMAAGLPFEYHPIKAARHTLLEHLRDPERFNESTRYPDTKLLSLLFVRELAEHTEVLVNCAHPGYMATDIFRSNRNLNLVMNSWFMRSFFARSVVDGATCIINAIALVGEESRGQYLSECVVTAPSSFVQSPDGLHLQNQSFGEVLAYVERVRPGILDEVDLH